MNKLQTILNDEIGRRTEVARSGSKMTETRSDAYGSEAVHFSRANGVAAHYEYAPFGEVTAQVRQGGITAYDFSALNPWRFSSEYSDDSITVKTVCDKDMEHDIEQILRLQERGVYQSGGLKGNPCGQEAIINVQ